MRRIRNVLMVCVLLLSLTSCSNISEQPTDEIGSRMVELPQVEEEPVEEAIPVTPIAKESAAEEPVVTPVAEEPEETTEQPTMLPMEVHYIDVGEADSALIKCGDEAMLVDTGNPDQGSTIRLYLKQNNVEKLKYLLLTHSDRDHIGGAASVISNVDIDNLFMCSYEKDNEIYENMMNEIDYKSMKWSTPAVGSTYELGDAVITIIAPNAVYDNPNDSSIAFVIRHGEDSFIFTGDAEVAAEYDIVNNGLDIEADVYYVGHHGSHTSSTQEFLDKVSPTYAVISCAKENEYGHPHIETMEKLKAMDVKLFRTDDQGTIICYSDGSNITFNTEPSDNWANGMAEVNESASTQVKQAMAEAKQNSEVDAGQESSEEITYVLNINSMKFHYPDCDSVNDMKEKNRQDVTLSREEIVELGYKPCQRCKP